MSGCPPISYDTANGKCTFCESMLILRTFFVRCLHIQLWTNWKSIYNSRPTAIISHILMLLNQEHSWVINHQNMLRITLRRALDASVTSVLSISEMDVGHFFSTQLNPTHCFDPWTHQLTHRCSSDTQTTWCTLFSGNWYYYNIV